MLIHASHSFLNLLLDLNGFPLRGLRHLHLIFGHSFHSSDRSRDGFWYSWKRKRGQTAKVRHLCMTGSAPFVPKWSMLPSSGCNDFALTFLFSDVRPPFMYELVGGLTTISFPQTEPYVQSTSARIKNERRSASVNHQSQARSFLSSDERE